MTASMELAFAALILWLSAVLDAVAFGPTIETLVVSWRRVSLALTLLLQLLALALIPPSPSD